MATLEFTFSIGADTYTKTITSTDTRALEFIDDLRNYYYPKVDDGAGGVRIMTRQETGIFYMNELSAAQNALAKDIKQRKLFLGSGTADNLGT